MSRRRKTIEREIFPDPKYNSIVLSQFINTVMKERQKKYSRKDRLWCSRSIEERTKEEPDGSIYTSSG